MGKFWKSWNELFAGKIQANKELKILNEPITADKNRRFLNLPLEVERGPGCPTHF